MAQGMIRFKVQPIFSWSHLSTLRSLIILFTSIVCMYNIKKKIVQNDRRKTLEQIRYNRNDQYAWSVPSPPSSPSTSSWTIYTLTISIPAVVCLWLFSWPSWQTSTLPSHLSFSASSTVHLVLGSGSSMCLITPRHSLGIKLLRGGGVGWWVPPLASTTCCGLYCCI